MTDGQTVSSEVEVAVDPATAFRAFTEEMDLWWVRGPINFFSDAGRVVEVRCEPGIGGRIGEVLDDPATGGLLEGSASRGRAHSTTSRLRFASWRRLTGRSSWWSTGSRLAGRIAGERPGAGWSPSGSVAGARGALTSRT
jgi:hypothetical protein